MTDPETTPHLVVGLVLAAGSGSRLGRPKALIGGTDGVSWLTRALGVLEAGGCQTIFVVIGAAADQVREVLPTGVSVVVADEWAEGMGASLRAGLAAVEAAEPTAAAVVVMLVDTPGVTGPVVGRLVARTAGPAGQRVSQALARVTYHGRLGHPVLIGRDHWEGVAATARGDRGARDYLNAHEVTVVECGDIGSGEDIDTPEALAAWRGRDRGSGGSAGG